MPNGNGSAYAVAQTQMGLAIETTKGTPMAAPTYMIPVKSPKYKPDQTEIPDETLQGSMVQVYDLIPGLRYDSHGWDGFPYLDSFPIFAACELGSTDGFTAAPTSTTLSAAAAAGATSITTVGTVAQGDYVVVGTGPTLETHLVTAVAGSATPYTLTLAYPLIYAQASGAAVTGLNKHVFSLLNSASNPGNQPPSVTLWDYDGEQWRQLSAAQLDELNIKGNATGLVDYTTTWFANPALTNVTAPSLSYTDVPTPAPWTFTAQINGTQVGTIVDWEVDLKRGVKPIPALTGTQEYFEYFANFLEATAKLTFVEQSSSPYLTDYLNSSKLSFDFNIFDLSTGDLMNIHCSNAKYKTGDLDRSKEYVEVTTEVQFLPSAADATAGGKSPIKITIANGVTSAYL